MKSLSNKDYNTLKDCLNIIFEEDRTVRYDNAVRRLKILRNKLNRNDKKELRKAIR